MTDKLAYSFSDKPDDSESERRIREWLESIPEGCSVFHIELSDWNDNSEIRSIDIGGE